MKTSNKATSEKSIYLNSEVTLIEGDADEVKSFSGNWADAEKHIFKRNKRPESGYYAVVFKNGDTATLSDDGFEYEWEFANGDTASVTYLDDLKVKKQRQS